MSEAGSKIAKPGTHYDIKDRPIYPGDLLKSPHFTERNGRKHWLYHVAVLVDGHLEMVPTSHLEPSKVNGGGRCWLSTAIAKQCEIIHGHGPGDCLDFTDRPKQEPSWVQRLVEDGGQGE